MHSTRILTVIGIAALTSGCSGSSQMRPAASAVDISDEQRAAIHTAMQDYIDDKLVEQGGGYNVEGVATDFHGLHDGVTLADGLYVSCADFMASEDNFDVDYYVKAEGDGFAVAKIVVHKHNGEEVNREVAP